MGKTIIIYYIQSFTSTGKNQSYLSPGGTVNLLTTIDVNYPQLPPDSPPEIRSIAGMGMAMGYSRDSRWGESVTARVDTEDPALLGGMVCKVKTFRPCCEPTAIR